MLSFFASITLVSAAVGDLVGTVNFSVPCSSGVGVGIAYDGTNLWYSCYSSATDLYRADPATGLVTASYSIAGSLGALAYDASRNALWAGWGDASGKVRLLQLNASKDIVSTTTIFTAGDAVVVGLDDGLAYDTQDDTLYFSDDVSTTIHHYSVNGTHLGDFSWAGSGCYNSGLALGGDLMYQGSDGCNQVWVVNKSDTSTVVFNFSTVVSGDPNFRDEDLECDTNTFAGLGKHVMWSVEAYEPRRAGAYEIPFNSCGIGGAQAACGDGNVDAGEQCDDGNNANGDGCSSTCQTEVPQPICGNSVVEAGEACDDGNTANGDGCSSTCQIEVPVCGNGFLEAGEACDDGNNANGDGCSAICEIEVQCPDNDGDGVNDCDDKCLNSQLDNISLNPNQYAQNINFGPFESGPGNQQSIVYDMTTTKGCTCKQIAEQLGVGVGHIKKGCSPSVMETWTGLSGNPDRQAGIGRNIFLVVGIVVLAGSGISLRLFK